MAQSYIGATLAISPNAVPAGTVNSPNLANIKTAATQAVGKIVQMPEIGDQAEDVSFTDLQSGAVIHINGARDMGDMQFVMDFDADDTGQDRVREVNNSNTTVAVLITDRVGSGGTVAEEVGFLGTVCNYRDGERQASNYKQAMFTIRGQSIAYRTA